MKKILLFLTAILLSHFSLSAQHSVARQWNEALLDAIRSDVSRPTVHSRNLYHVSAVMYDAWAAYDDVATTILLGHTIGEYTCEFNGIEIPSDSEARKAAQEEAISYAAYRLLSHRFATSPGAETTLEELNTLMTELGYDPNFTSTDYADNNPASLGNYLAVSCMEFGLVDYSDEEFGYEYSDEFYQPINPPLVPTSPGNPDIVDLDHWQPLSLSPNTARRFLNPHWGKVTPFSLTEDDLTVYEKNDSEYYVYLDPGHPSYISETEGLGDDYKWMFALVAVWSGHLDPAISTMVDISPASVGNLTELPETVEEMRSFYNLIQGGVDDQGYTENPATGQPYETQMVPLGDFGRVLAEFWADGPNSETPPGHWFTILNYVNDYPGFEKRFKGEGEILDDLEWDIKAYVALGAAMHDVAVTVWGIKSYYDYVRPISAIRGMAALGQSSDSNLMSYHPNGIPLIGNRIELVLEGDALAGDNNENVGKIKLYAWRGPDYINGPDGPNAGVDWILAENWWPYQQPSFITPPFAGYVSGHSTFSRAAAEVLTLLTGDEYFPGGMGVFDAPQNEYLLFEEGPSVDIQLQWAKYRDASDQASLSRLWGGIHPPVDDIPGRKIGATIGPKVFHLAEDYFNGLISSIDEPTGKSTTNDFAIVQNYPNPVKDYTIFEYSVKKAGDININIYDLNGKLVHSINEGHKTPGVYQSNASLKLNAGFYVYRLEANDKLSAPRKLFSVGALGQ